MKNFLIVCGIFVAAVGGLILVAVMVLGTLIETGQVPDSAALPKNKISPSLVAKLREMEVIEADEEVQFYYSSALFSYEEEGNLFTDRRVISYEGTDVYSATWDQIEDIEFEDSDSFFEDALITVTTTDDDYFYLIVSSESKLDNAFYKQMNKLWEKNRGEGSGAAATAEEPLEAEDNDEN